MEAKIVDIRSRANQIKKARTQNQKVVRPQDFKHADNREGRRAFEREFGKIYPYMEVRMKMTLKQLNEPLFFSALHKLDSCSKFATPQIAWSVMKIVKGCHNIIKEQRELYQKMTKEYAKLDENGEVVLNHETHEIEFKDDASMKEHDVKFKEMMAMEVDVAVSQLELDDIGPVQLSPNELNAIELLIIV